MDRRRNPPPNAASGAIRDVALPRAGARPRRGRGVGICYSPNSMSSSSQTSAPQATPNAPAVPEPKPKRSMSRTQKILFFATGWLIVLMPFLFWWNTWFGRHLSDQQLTEYLHDDKKPRHIQHALVQMGERMAAQDKTQDDARTVHDAVKQWYPDLLRLAVCPVEEVRNTDAWVMGQDISGAGFHEALLKMLADSSPMVRGNAALSLVRFGDSTGRPQIVALLQPATINAPTSGHVIDADRPGTAIHQGGLLAKLATPGTSEPIEVRSPIPGRIRSVSQPGANVVAGTQIAVVDPATEQVWEALRALYLVGQADDLPAIGPYERDLPYISNDVRQQAQETEKAIRTRSN